MSSKTAAFITLGCKINQYETEAIRQEVLDLGYREVPPAAPADVYVVNTCSVTATSGQKSGQHIRRAARTNPAARIIVVGCSTPGEKAAFAKVPQVALLAGNEEKAMVASFLSGGWKPGEPFAEKERDILELQVSRYTDRTRATVKVQDGCSSFCSFCIIPFLRGLSRSRHPDAVAEEVRRLVATGSLEVVISGVHLQDYGLDLSPPARLTDLLRRLAATPGLRRLRLSSLGTRAFSPEMLDLLEDPVFCRHWHIPLQSGADEVLRRMRRGYDTGQFRSTAGELRRRFDEPAITTDVIAGHPGESAAHFEETLAVCRELAFAKIHVFPYSVREGTLASKMKDKVSPAEVHRRARALDELDRELSLAYKRRFLGRELEVLVEGAEAAPPAGEPQEGAGAALLEGLADRYLRVRFPAPSAFARRRFPGTLQRVRVLELTPAGELQGVWAEEPVLS
jgi:threonylcarbamoyladenosine tRNA methylthiotransferase MtaB